MPILKDYISALVTSMTEARVNADTFSANVARLYLENDMLRHFPVPRMRIGDVEINAPVAINAAESKPVINKPNLSLVSDKVYTVVCLGFDLKVADVDKNTNASKALREGITSEIEGIGNNINESNYSDVLKNGSNKIANSSLSILEKFNFSVDKNKVSEVANIVESTLTKEFVSKKIEDMDVIVEASKLKEFPSNTLLNLKINLVEDGMQWAISKNDKDEIETKLMPE
ncbi:MAG: hypothetical protein II575_08180 [Bacteroidales bacterium]|nr:hypothetical protein [Bacteroidales bacterium]MBQ2574183.1 hypothetical protein [Bacteroidales bacterium]MBQ5425163.1 hypothetical protein [Bacteroidales bacterium]